MPSLTLLENQGFSNTNYLLKTSKQNYIIKVFGSLHVDRKKEFKITREAYKKGIGAKPIYQDNLVMISEFLEGFHKHKLKRADIKNIALLLKKLHSIKLEKKLFNYKKDYTLCHHDLNPKNFIFSKDIKLIDWEYAGTNDRYFDLATVIVEFDLNQYQQKFFLNAYFKNSFNIDRKKLSSFQTKYLNICIKWFNKQNNQKEKLRCQKFIIGG